MISWKRVPTIAELAAEKVRAFTADWTEPERRDVERLLDDSLLNAGIFDRRAVPLLNCRCETCGRAFECCCGPDCPCGLQ